MDSKPNEIIGVTANSRTGDLTQAAEPEIYASLWQFGAFSKHLVVRTKADPRTLVGAIQRELRAVDPTVAAARYETFGSVLSPDESSRSDLKEHVCGRCLAGF